jgi:membrane fusion protein, multidrug efflux system
MDRRQRRWIWLLAACVVAVAAYFVLTRADAGRSAAGSPRPSAAPAPVPVQAAPARTRDIGVSLVGLGAGTPRATVTVKTQVNGQLIAVNFQERQLVRRGDLLAEIAPRPFQAQLTQFEGQLVRHRPGGAGQPLRASQRGREKSSRPGGDATTRGRPTNVCESAPAL